jgi:hypothetical protein
MIHLLTARHLRRPCGPLFHVGAVAPDALDDWRQKNITHLRDCPDRAAALAALARRTDPADDFAEGALLHLFTDWLWDDGHLRRYLDSLGTIPPNGAWVPGYRHEISRASAYIFCTEPWAAAVWQGMLAVPQTAYGALQKMTPQDIAAFLQSNHAALQRAGHKNCPPSHFYPPAQVAAFARAAAHDYEAWRGHCDANLLK